MPKSAKERCLDEKGRSCTTCGSEENICVHHVHGFYFGSKLANLMTVCASCHGKIHTGADGYEEWCQKLPIASRVHETGHKMYGHSDVRTAVKQNNEIEMDLTGFMKEGKRYEITKTDTGFVAEVYD